MKGIQKTGREKHAPFLYFLIGNLVLFDWRIIKALDAAFAKKEAYGYQELADALREAYASVGVSLGGNKVVSLITTLKNKRMIEQRHGKKYSFLPDFHY